MEEHDKMKDRTETERLAELGRLFEERQRLDAERAAREHETAERLHEVGRVARAAATEVVNATPKVDVAALAAAVVVAQRAADKAEEKELEAKGKRQLYKAVGFAAVFAYAGFFISMIHDAITDEGDDSKP